jgi:uncharacterized membrane protein
MTGVTGVTGPGGAQAIDRRIGRLLIVITDVAVVLLVIGLALMVLDGIGPLSGGPRLDPGSLLADLAALKPAAFLWLGILAVIATPVSRVVVAAFGYARRGDRAMVAISVAILVVIALAVASGVMAG